MTAPAPVTRAVMLERDLHRCYVCGVLVSLEAQHRQAVGMGGSKIRPLVFEVITLCTVHNSAAEAELQGQALRYGWKVQKWVKDCTLVPVFDLWGRQWFRLTVEGLRLPIGWPTAMEMMRAVYGGAYDEEKGLVS